MSGEVLIQVENVSKKFCRDLKRSLWYGVQDIAGELFARNSSKADLRPEEFWALKDVSFDLRRGESLGLIGRNGAGKSTLLKILNGLIKPDCGRVMIRGQVGALIELGAGFNPILSGRENIYVNAAVLGMSRRKVDTIIDQVIEFAEIGEFIDAPVQSYSSGMKVRLGFATAAHLKPDILLIDEVLAVGDAAFRRRCINHIRHTIPNTATILVSHNLRQVEQTCAQAIYLKRGRVEASGLSADVTANYLGTMNREDASRAASTGANREGTGECRFTKVQVAGAISGSNRLSHSGETLIVEAEFMCYRPMHNVRFRVGIEDLAVSALVTAANCEVPYIPEGGGHLRCEFPSLALRPRAYTILLAIADFRTPIDLWPHAAELVVVGGRDLTVQYSITDREIIYLPHRISVNFDQQCFSHAHRINTDLPPVWIKDDDPVI